MNYDYEVITRVQQYSYGYGPVSLWTLIVISAITIHEFII